MLSAGVIILLVIAAAIVIMAAPSIPLWAVLPAFVLIRALGDWGLAANRSPVPPGIIGAAVSIGFVLCLVVPWYRPVPRRAVGTVLAAALWCGFFGLIAFVGAGLGVQALGEALRLFSVITAGALVARLPFEHRARLRTTLLIAALVPAAYQLFATVVEVPGTFQPDTGRVMGTFSHPNPAGCFFVLGALYSWSVVQQRSSAVLGWLTLVVSVSGAITTQNLSAVGALFAAALVMRMASPGLRVGRRVAELALLVLAGVAMLFVPQIQGRLQEFQNIDLSASGVSADSANSLEWRLINWSRLLEIWVDQPWLGYGLSSTDSVIIPLGSPPHSGPVQLLVETGILGFVTATAGLAVLAAAAWRRRTPGDSGPSLVLGIIVVILIVGSMDNIVNYAAALYLAAVCVGLGLTGGPPAEGPGGPGGRGSLGRGPTDGWPEAVSTADRGEAGDPQLPKRRHAHRGLLRHGRDVPRA